LYTNISLKEFIQDFAFKQTNDAIVFESNIVYHNNGETKEKKSEVRIKTLPNKQLIYLLHIDNTETPDQFDTEHDTISYIPKLCLRIDKKDGQSTVLIFPKK
jgi:hypothetical protein